VKFLSFSYFRSHLFFIPRVQKKATKKFRLVHHVLDSLSLFHYYPLVFALLNCQLHRVSSCWFLVSSLLEFRGLVTFCSHCIRIHHCPLYSHLPLSHIFATAARHPSSVVAALHQYRSRFALTAAIVSHLLPPSFSVASTYVEKEERSTSNFVLT